MGTGHERLFLRGRVWWCWGYDAGGKRWQESTRQRDPVAAKLAARGLARRYAATPDRRKAKAQEELTLARGLDLYQEFQAKQGREPATLRATSYHAGHLLDVLPATLPLVDVSLTHTSAYLETRLGEGAGKHTVAKELIALQAAIRRCAKLGLMVPRVDPSHLTPDELGTVYTPRERWLTGPEHRALRAQLEEHRKDYLDAYCYLGLRKTELFAMVPGDYDAKRFTLRVRGTKTDAAKRTVPVAEPVREILKRRNKAEDPFPVWHTVCRDLERACVRAKIPKTTPNDLRRTFCSWLCQAGVPERVCADLLGHEDTTMVRAVYGHLDQKTLAGAVAKLPTPRAAKAAATKVQQRRKKPRKTPRKRAA